MSLKMVLEVRITTSFGRIARGRSSVRTQSLPAGLRVKKWVRNQNFPIFCDCDLVNSAKKTMTSPTGSCDEGHTWYCSQTPTLFFPDDLCYKTTEYNGLMRQKESQKDEDFLLTYTPPYTPNRLEDNKYPEVMCVIDKIINFMIFSTRSPFKIKFYWVCIIYWLDMCNF